jgi:LEA14-like dessication related protein
MKKYGVYIATVIGAVALYFLSKAQAGKQVKVYFNSLSLGKVKGLNLPEILAKFRIVNPTNTPLSVRSLAGDIFVNDSQFASLQQNEPLEIPANNEVIYTVKLQVPALSILTTVLPLLKSKKKIKITYTGTINSMGILIPISDTIYQS